MEPLLFREVETGEYLLFRTDVRGRVTHLFTGLEGSRKIRWYEQPFLHLGVAGLAMIAFVGALGVGIAGLLRRCPDAARLSRWFRLTAVSLSLLSLVFLGVVGGAAGTKGALFFMFGLPAAMVPFMYLPYLVIGLTGLLAVLTVLAWKTAAGSLTGRLLQSAMTISALGFVWFLHVWNLIGA